MKTKQSASIALLSVALLATGLLSNGCASSEPAPIPGMPETYAPQQIYFAPGEDLSEHLKISPITRSFDGSGLMHIIVPVRLASDLGQTIDYRVTWFDENRTPVDNPTGWTTRFIEPDTLMNLEANSSTPRARDFQMDFRLAK